jgi:N-acetylmuramoyl-L-alanine amidase
MYVLQRKQIVFMCLCLVFSVAYFSFQEVETIPTSSTPVTSHTVVLDAGHGLPDGGAVSTDGVSEESINLNIVLKLQELLESSNCTVVLTRSDENGIYDADSKSKKVSDLKNRVEIINNSGADILVSIHLNKISGEKYYGWQSFYQPENEQSKNLASFIQTNLNYYIDRDNQRTILPLSNIYIMDNSKIPAVTIECGFLSNQEDTALLQTDEYQNNIAWGIYAGIMDYFK